MANPPNGSSFLHVNVPDDLLKRVDDFRFKYRFENRAEALRWLLDWALDQKPKPEAI